MVEKETTIDVGPRWRRQTIPDRLVPVPEGIVQISSLHKLCGYEQASGLQADTILHAGKGDSKTSHGHCVSLL